MKNKIALILSLTAAGLTNPARAQDHVIHVDLTNEEQAALSQANDELADILKRIDKSDLPKIEFNFDSWKVRPESGPTLDAFAHLMLHNPMIKLMIFAHTDRIGSEKYNLWLSGKRAKSIKGELVLRGVPPPSIRFRGRGYSQPIADNNTEEGRAKNRRVEFRLLARWWSAVY